jgi:hypothetical protein
MNVRFQILLLALVGCGISEQLPEDFREHTRCEFPAATVASERPLDCDQMQKNLDVALEMYEALKLRPLSPALVLIWDLQILYCDQYFLGACVHLVKGNSNGNAKNCRVNLNSGAELLLHEFLHCAVDDPDHSSWGSNGFAAADWAFRNRVGWLE